MKLNLLKKDTRNRIWEIDFLRGLPIFGLLLYHLGYDILMLPYVLSNFYTIPNFTLTNFVRSITDIMTSQVVDSLVPVFAGTFLLVTGISCSFSKNNIFRGLRLVAFAYTLTLLSYILSIITKYDTVIIMGVIHCMGLTVLFYGLVEWAFKKLNIALPDYLPFMAGILIIFIGLFISHSPRPIPYPEFDIKDFWGIFIGTIGSSTDWFPIFPWSGVILVGISFGKWFYKDRKSLAPNLLHGFERPICFIGRHTLLIYATHQILYIGVLATILLPMGYRL